MVGGGGGGEGDCGSSALTTNSLTMEILTVIKEMVSLKSRNFSQKCFLSNSLNTLMEVESGLARRQCLE